jgi:hypothetical protein
MKTLHLALAAACLLATLSSGAAPAAPAETANTTEVKLGDITWEIRYASKKENGTLVDAKGRMTKAPEGSKPMHFAATQCLHENDTLALSGWFVICEGSSEICNTAPQTHAVLKNDGRFSVFGGPAKTRIVQK